MLSAADSACSLAFPRPSLASACLAMPSLPEGEEVLQLSSDADSSGMTGRAVCVMPLRKGNQRADSADTVLHDSWAASSPLSAPSLASSPLHTPESRERGSVHTPTSEFSSPNSAKGQCSVCDTPE